MVLTPWDVYLANVPFEDVRGSKKRPVVVIDTPSGAEAFVLKMTSHQPRAGYNEYVISDLSPAGLRKPTTVRIDKRILLNKADFISRIGSLSMNDILGILTKMRGT